MDTLYLVFKHQFQIVFGFALQTIKLRLKQTETLTDEVHSVKARFQTLLVFLLGNKSAALLALTPKGKATLQVAIGTLFGTPKLQFSAIRTGIIKTTEFLSRALQNFTLMCEASVIATH
jgi:hypothetical protein